MDDLSKARRPTAAAKRSQAGRVWSWWWRANATMASQALCVCSRAGVRVFKRVAARRWRERKRVSRGPLGG